MNLTSPLNPIVCPKCGNPHQCGIFPALPEIDVPERLLCKWCGYYYSERFGLRQCVPNAETGVWELRNEHNAKFKTPAEQAGFSWRISR